MAVQWYYTRQGGPPQGPVSLGELQRLLESGQVSGHDLVWRDGLANWVAAGSQGLRSTSKKPTPSPTTSRHPLPPPPPPVKSTRMAARHVGTPSPVQQVPARQVPARQVPAQQVPARQVPSPPPTARATAAQLPALPPSRESGRARPTSPRKSLALLAVAGLLISAGGIGFGYVLGFRGNGRVVSSDSASFAAQAPTAPATSPIEVHAPPGDGPSGDGPSGDGPSGDGPSGDVPSQVSDQGAAGSDSGLDAPGGREANEAEVDNLRDGSVRDDPQPLNALVDSTGGATPPPMDRIAQATSESQGDSVGQGNSAGLSVTAGQGNSVESGNVVELTRGEVPMADPTTRQSATGSAETPKDEPVASPAEPPTVAASEPSQEPSKKPASVSLHSGSALLYQDVEVQRKPRFAVQGMTIQQHAHYRILSRIEIEPASDDGTRKVLQYIEDTKLEQADDLSKATFAQSLEKLKHKQYSFKLNARGEVTDFEGHAKNLAALPVQMLGGQGFQLTSVIDKDGWKELAELTCFQPNESSRESRGMRRSMHHDWEPLGSWYGTTTFRAKNSPGRGRKTTDDDAVQRFEYQHDMAYAPPKKQQQALPFEIRGAEFKTQVAGGTILYDPRLRRVTQVQEQFEVMGQVAMQLLGQPTTIQLHEQQQLIIRLTEQRPEW